jgi:CHASE1-domain containing sensor protein
MEAARDSGRAAASAPVTLVQEVERSEPGGFLIYVPVYREGDVPATIAERRTALVGFAYSPFRASDLFGEVLGTSQNTFKLRVYDSPVTGTAGYCTSKAAGRREAGSRALEKSTSRAAHGRCASSRSLRLRLGRMAGIFRC